MHLTRRLSQGAVMQRWRMYRLIHILRAFKRMKTLRLTLENTQEKKNLGWSQHTETIFCVLGHKNDASNNRKWSRVPIISIPLLRRWEPASYYYVPRHVLCDDGLLLEPVGFFRLLGLLTEKLFDFFSTVFWSEAGFSPCNKYVSLWI